MVRWKICFIYQHSFCSLLFSINRDIPVLQNTGIRLIPDILSLQATLLTTLCSIQLVRLCYLYTVTFIMYLKSQLPSVWSCCLNFSCFYCLRVSSAITKYTTIFKRKILKYCLEILRHPGTPSQKDWQLKKQRTKNSCW